MGRTYYEVIQIYYYFQGFSSDHRGEGTSYRRFPRKLCDWWQLWWVWADWADVSLSGRVSFKKASSQSLSYSSLNGQLYLHLVYNESTYSCAGVPGPHLSKKLPLKLFQNSQLAMDPALDPQCFETDRFWMLFSWWEKGLHAYRPDRWALSIALY